VEDGSRKPEDRRLKTEDRRWNIEGGSRKTVVNYIYEASNVRKKICGFNPNQRKDQK